MGKKTVTFNKVLITEISNGKDPRIGKMGWPQIGLSLRENPDDEIFDKLSALINAENIKVTFEFKE